MVAGSTVAGSGGDAPPDTTVAVEESAPTVSEGFVIPAATGCSSTTRSISPSASPTRGPTSSPPPTPSTAPSSPRSTPPPTSTCGVETFDAPGVLYAAYPFTDDNEALYRERFEPASAVRGQRRRRLRRRGFRRTVVAAHRLRTSRPGRTSRHRRQPGQRGDHGGRRRPTGQPPGPRPCSMSSSTRSTSPPPQPGQPPPTPASTHPPPRRRPCHHRQHRRRHQSRPPNCSTAVG